MSVGVIQDEDLRLVGTAAHTLGGAGRCYAVTFRKSIKASQQSSVCGIAVEIYKKL